MRKTFNTTLKGALLAGITAAAISSAQAQIAPPWGSTYAQGDLLVGFDLGTGSGNDIVVNLGQAQSVLVNGQQWNLTTALSGTTVGSLQWGVIGVTPWNYNANYGSVLSTVSTGNTPDGFFNNASGWGQIRGAVNTIGNNGVNGAAGYGTDIASDIYSWYTETVNGATGTFVGNFDNPNGQMGLGSEDFYTSYYAGNNALDGFWTLSVVDGNDILTYNAVPEPITFGLFSGVGLLALAIRRQFARAA